MKTNQPFMKHIQILASALSLAVSMTLSAEDQQTPRAARWLIVSIIVHAISPIDLIPDPIPVLGYLDDLLLLPLGIALVLRLIPKPVMAKRRESARLEPLEIPPA